MAIKQHFKKFVKTDEPAVKTCLMIGGSGMAQVWLKNFTDNFSDRIKVIGLCDVNQEVLDRSAKMLGLAKEALFTDFNEACAKVRADFCGIVIPPQFHSPAAIAAMENGMPVICEKPIADTMEAAKTILHTSQKTGLPCTIIQQFRYVPNKQELVRIREEGRLGRLQHIVGRYADDYQRFVSKERPHRRLLFEGCIHHFDMLRFLSGADCETLMGLGWSPEWSSFDHWSSGFYLMRMTNGMHTSYEGNSSAAGMTTSWHSYYRAEFEQGTVEIDDSEQVTIHRIGSKPKRYKAPKIARFGHAHLFDEFLNWLDDGSSSVTHIEDNIKSFAMAVAALEATVDGKPKQIADYLSDLDLSNGAETLKSTLVQNSVNT